MRISDLGARLHSGQASIDVVGRRRGFYLLSVLLLVVSIGALGVRGLNLGVEFTGGADFTVPNATCTVEQARQAAVGAGHGEAIVTESGSGTVRVQTQALTTQEAASLTTTLATACGVQAADVKSQVIGPTWGAEISKKALQGLLVFLLLVALFLSVYFEWRMALAALAALAHDLVITVGIYALTGLEVTPATVIGLLTILGYSLYDTVVVFDKVRENTRDVFTGTQATYAERVNLAVDQTLVRSFNTTLVALAPVVAIIVVGAGLLGAGTLLDLAVALGVGMATGAYSSVFLAAPLLVQIKQRSPQVQAHAARVLAKRASGPRAQDPVPAAGPRRKVPRSRRKSAGRR